MTDINRYHRQMLLPGIGETGQRRLRESSALLVGCGALGSSIADTLTRAGIGRLRIIDRDLVELTNLQRQVLFDERDAANGAPKAQAAAARLAAVNGEITLEPVVDDFNPRNAERLAENTDIILDGLDNFETRYLLNDLAVSRGVPYVYGGAVGVTGMSMTILPHGAHRHNDNDRAVAWTDEQATPCLRCVFPDPPPPGSSPTCDTAGVLGPVIGTVAAHQSAQAIKLLTGNVDAVDRSLLSLDMWSNTSSRFDVSGSRIEDCPCCGRGQFEFLKGGLTSATTSLCGRDAVQISPPAPGSFGSPGPPETLDLASIAAALGPHGSFTHNKHLLRGTFTSEKGVNGKAIELTLFPNGRAIIKGVTEPDAARTIYARYVGA